MKYSYLYLGYEGHSAHIRKHSNDDAAYRAFRKWALGSSSNSAKLFRMPVAETGSLACIAGCGDGEMWRK